MINLWEKNVSGGIHLNSFNPAISHYAPNRLYLSPELTAVEIHADYLEESAKVGMKSVSYQR